MGDDGVCNTKLGLGIGLANSTPKADQEKNKRLLSLELSIGDEEQSSRNSNDDNGGEIRKKLRLTKEQSSVLEDNFKARTNLNIAQKNELAAKLGLKPRQVEVWFQNRRARTKLKQTETDCELWKKNFEDLSEENHMLRKEIQELQALKINEKATFYAQLTNCMAISVCPTCKKVEGVPKGSGDARLESAATIAASVSVVQKPKYKHSGLKIRG